MTKTLIIGWLLGLTLVLAFFQSATAAQDKITICHANGNGSYITLTLPYNAVFGKSEKSGHFNEQGTPNAGHENDYLGPCIPPVTTTTAPEVTTSTSTTSTTTTPEPTTTSSSVATTTTTVPQSTSTSTPRQTTTTSIVQDTCEDLGTCQDTTTTTGPTTTIPDGSTTTVPDGSTTTVADTSTTVPPSTLAYGGSDAAGMFAPWAALITLFGAAASFLARRPA